MEPPLCPASHSRFQFLAFTANGAGIKLILAGRAMGRLLAFDFPISEFSDLAGKGIH
jgi:hypothetical protein